MNGTMEMCRALLLACMSLASCATTIEWQPLVVHRTHGSIERIRCGRPDGTDAKLQAVSVDQAGDVALIQFDRDEPRAEILYRNGAELTGLTIADVDPSAPGEEIYAGGYLPGGEGAERGGGVYQIVVTPSSSARAQVRQVYSGNAYVHSIERVPPQRAGDPARLLISTYGGEIRLLTPSSSDAPWDNRLLFALPQSDDPEANQAKDAAFLRSASGRPPHEVLVVFRSGRMLFLDLDRPESARIVHEEPGGLARVTPDEREGAYVIGYTGRVLHFHRDGDGFRYDAIDDEGVDSGLRGIVRGRFPSPHGGVTQLALYGYHKQCRILHPKCIGLRADYTQMDADTIYVDAERGHALEAADVVAGNDGDELLLGGASKQVTVLVAKHVREK
ncbi:MAG: hypothetical protein ACKVWV_02275 [Planctomycetota bacterium]